MKVLYNGLIIEVEVQQKPLGDRIAAVAQPIAGAIDKVLGTNLKNCPGCKRTQQNLNNGMSLADAFFDRFWKPKE